MTLLNDLWTNYELDPALAIPSFVAALSFVLAAIAIWAFVRARRVLRVLPALEERVEVLNHSISLLTDTTESCFKALSMQLQFMQSQNVLRPSPRPEAMVRARRSSEKARPKSVGAARRQAALAALAASEKTAPSTARIVNGGDQSASLVSTFVA
jgi:hypothetical protein